MMARDFNVQDFGARDPWPGLPTTFTVTADVINDGKDISIKLPKEFAGLRLSADRDERNEWSWILYLETNERDGNKVQSGSGENSYLRFSVNSFPELKVRPVANSYWNSRRIGSKILVGKLFEHLTFRQSNPYWAGHDKSRPSSRNAPLIRDEDRWDDPDDDAKHTTTEADVVKEMNGAQFIPDPSIRRSQPAALPEFITKKPEPQTAMASAITKAVEKKAIEVSPAPSPGTYYLNGKHVQKKEKEEPMSAQPSPTPPTPQKPRPEVEMLKQALALINNAIASGMLTVKQQPDMTLKASVTTTIDL